MNIMISVLLKFINNPDQKDINYNIAYYFITHYKEISKMSLNEVAEACYVSPSTLTRFFQSIGIPKFSLFKKMATMHETIRIGQIEARYHKPTTKTETAILNILNQDDYELITNSEIIETCCQKISECSRIVMVGSIEMMDALTRFQVDLTVMGKPVIHISIIDDKNDFGAGDFVIFLSMTGNIAELQNELIRRLAQSQVPLLCVGQVNYLGDNSLFLRIPDYLEEALENMILGYYFQRITYSYYGEYYDNF